MNKEIDEFSNAIDNIKVQREKSTFKLSQLKVEHFHLYSDEADIGMPISTSIELLLKYNIDTNDLKWKKIITHRYYSLDNITSIEENTHEENTSNIESIIKEIEKNDLRNLKNNYYTDSEPESLTHWELTYNNIFKIVGTYDQNVEEFEKISQLLNLNSIIDNETKKINNKRINQQ